MSDGGMQWYQQSGLQEEYEAWLRDPEAQREYQLYLNSKDSTWAGTHKTQAAAISNKHRRAHTSGAAFD